MSCRNKPRYKPVIKAPEPLERLAKKIRNAGEFGQGPGATQGRRYARAEARFKALSAQMRCSRRRYGVFKRFLQNELANGSEDEAEQPPLFLPSRTEVIDSVQFLSARWRRLTPLELSGMELHEVAHVRR